MLLNCGLLYDLKIPLTYVGKYESCAEMCRYIDLIKGQRFEAIFDYTILGQELLEDEV